MATAGSAKQINHQQTTPSTAFQLAAQGVDVRLVVVQAQEQVL